MTTLAVPAPAVWGVGRVVRDGVVTPWAVTQADIEDETRSAVEHLRSFGVDAGDVVLLVSLLSQAVHVAPFELAVGEMGGLYSSADATPGDAFRVEVLVRRLAPRAVLGITRDVVGGFAEAGLDVADVLGSVPGVATTDEDAHAALAAAGLTPRRWLFLGPTSALDCAERAGAHVDGERWRAEADGSIGARVAGDARDTSDAREVLVTNVVPRHTPAVRLATGIRGHVLTDPCACGRPGPRVVVASGQEAR